MIVANRQLDVSQICDDLQIDPNLFNERSCALGVSLVKGITSALDPSVYYVPLTAGSTDFCRVILHENPYGKEHGSVGRLSPSHTDTLTPSDTLTLTACSCADWQTHHRVLFGLNPMSSAWMCSHGASVLLSLGRSETYLDFISLPKAPPVATVEMDFGLDRRRFFAALGKKYRYQWGVLGINLEMAQEAYRLRFGTNSLSKLKQCEWAIAAAEMQAAVQSKTLMKNRAAEIKYLLSEAIRKEDA